MNSPAVRISLNFGWLIEGQLAGCAAPMLRADLDFLRSQGVLSIVRMAVEGKDDYVLSHSDIVTAGVDDLHEPVEDFQAPAAAQIERVLGFIEASLAQGKPVAVSCGAGCGRTGTILACYLVNQGHSATEAIRALIDRRPCSEEIVTLAPHQAQAVHEFAARRGKGRLVAGRGTTRRG